MNYKTFEQNKKEIAILKELLHKNRTYLNDVTPLAQTIKSLICKIDPFIQSYTSIVCPECRNKCCINKHSQYDFEDLLYIYALDVEIPISLEEVDESAPCQFLSLKGCTIERFRRPFKCNWYFCESLLKAMIDGPARPYRAFVTLMGEIVQTRGKMIDEFFAILENR